MVETDDEYERERQENIRKNQELLLSLGLNVSSTDWIGMSAHLAAYFTFPPLDAFSF